MMDEPEEQAPALAPVVPPDLRLRGERPRVTRLSRKVLITLGAVSALTIAGALGYALQTRNRSQTGQELLSTQSRPSAEGLAGLPKDYTGLPRQAPQLGPPLPGDLGKPILNAGAAPNTSVSATTPDPAAQRLAQETEAARVSRLFAQTNQQPQPVGLVAPPATATQGGPTPTPPVDAGSAQNMQDRKTAFLNAVMDKRTVSSDRLEAKASPYVVQAGTVIPAALITGIRSDLPGQITAQVTEAVYDSPTGQYLLIPQGAKLIGQYDSSVAFGQSRILLVWTRIIMPDGSSVQIDNLPATDSAGYSGLEDQVDFHTWALIKGVAISTLLGVGSQLAISGQSDLMLSIRNSTQDSVNQAGQQTTQKNLNIQPTIKVRPGWPLRVIVRKDIVLRPYRG